MTNFETTSSSLAQQLMKSGFKQTSIMRAITELVGSYLWNTVIEWDLLSQLRTTKTAIDDLVNQPAWEVKPSTLTLKESNTELTPQTLRKAAVWIMIASDNTDSSRACYPFAH